MIIMINNALSNDMGVDKINKAKILHVLRTRIILVYDETNVTIEQLDIEVISASVLQ